MRYPSVFLLIFIVNQIFAANIKGISDKDVSERIKILDSLDRNFLVSNSNKGYHNINKIEYYSYELFKNKLHKIRWVEQNSDHEILFAFFKELYFKNNDKLSLLFSCYNFYASTYTDLIKNSSFPEYLMLLPAVLTGYNYKYLTLKGAGMWRMNYTLGIWSKLLINSSIDERFHAYKSSIAAYRYIEHLQGLYKNFDNVLCAYLSSPVAVNNWLKEIKEDDRLIDKVSQDVYLDFHFYKTLVYLYYMREDLGIVPLILNYTTETDSVFINKRFHFEPIIKSLNLTMGELVFLNPQYKNNFSKDSNYLILPRSMVQTFRNNEKEIVNQNDSIYFREKTLGDTLIEKISENVYHVVKRGETLSQIARRYKSVTVEDLVRLNGLKSPDKVKDGKRLIIIKNQ